MAVLEVPLPCGAGGVKRVAGDGMERRKAPNQDLLPFGEGLMAAAQLLHTREPHLTNTNSGKASVSSPSFLPSFMAKWYRLRDSRGRFIAASISRRSKTRRNRRKQPCVAGSCGMGQGVQNTVQKV